MAEYSIAGAGERHLGGCRNYSVTQLHVRCSGATLRWQNYSVTKILYAVQWSYIEVASLLSYSQLHVQVQWSYIEVDENGEALSSYDELSNYDIESAYQ